MKPPTSQPNSSNSLPLVEIHTDGGCIGNPGIGAWAAVLRSGRHTREVSGGQTATTNNRMELQAAIEALNALKKPCRVELHTDSEYLRNGITQWLSGWKKNGWRTRDKKAVKNADLWRTLETATQRHQIDWKWVKGHAGVADNERCDQLAGEVMARIKREHSAAQLAAALKAFKQSQQESIPTPDLLG